MYRTRSIPDHEQCLTNHMRTLQTADIWSCGVMLYVMLVGSYPFERPEDKGDPKKLQNMIQVCKRVYLYGHFVSICYFRYHDGRVQVDACAINIGAGSVHGHLSLFESHYYYSVPYIPP